MTLLGRAANHHPFSNFTRQNVETKRGSILKPGLRVSYIRNIFAVITKNTTKHCTSPGGDLFCKATIGCLRGHPKIKGCGGGGKPRQEHPRRREMGKFGRGEKVISGRNKLAPETTYQSISPSVCPSLRFGWIPEIQRVSSRVQNYISCEPLVGARWDCAGIL